MPGRQYSSNTYRYGFNGKENDNETVGTGEGTQDYGMRIYNPALGRFLSVDPLQKEYPFLTPYQFASNSPIMGIDLDGLEFAHYSLTYSDGKPVFKLLGMQTRFIGTGQSLIETMSLGAVKYKFDEYDGDVIDGFAGIYVHTDKGTYYFGTAEQAAQFAIDNGPNSTASIEQMEEWGTMLVGVTTLWADAQNGNIESVVAPKIEIKPEVKPQVSANNGVESTGEKAPVETVVNKPSITYEGQTYEVNATTPYTRPNNATTPAQRAFVNGPGAQCVTCGTYEGPFRADHKDPLAIEHISKGAIDTKKMRSKEAVQPQCQGCSDAQGAKVREAIKPAQKILKGKR